MTDACKAVKNAINGAKLDINAVEYLAYDISEALSVRDELVPLLVQLVAVNPEAAKEVPENVITNLLHGLNVEEVFEKTQLDVSYLNDLLIRPVLLAQIAAKATAADKDVIRTSVELLADAALETESVSSIEKLIQRLPAETLPCIPFATLFNGPAELKSRLMDINIKLLRRKTLPPSNYLIWDSLVTEDSDILLAALQTDYVGNLASFVSSQPEIQSKVHAAIYELCKRYRNSSLDNTIERALGQYAIHAENLFLELDAQFLLVREDRPSLIARIPAAYVLKHHPDIPGKLDLNIANLNAIANLAQDFRGLQAVQLTGAKLAGLPVPSQLLLAAAATGTAEGARYFHTQFGDILQNAVNIAEDSETRDLKATLRANLSQWGIRIRATPSVQTA